MCYLVTTIHVGDIQRGTQPEAIDAQWKNETEITAHVRESVTLAAYFKNGVGLSARTHATHCGYVTQHSMQIKALLMRQARRVNVPADARQHTTPLSECQHTATGRAAISSSSIQPCILYMLRERHQVLAYFMCHCQMP